MRNLKYIKKSFFVLALCAMAFTSCEEDLEGDLSNFVGFQSLPIFDVPRDTADSREIIIASTEISSTDRTYNLVVNETTTLLAEYSVPSTVTIPANSNTGSFTINVTDDEMLSFTAQKLVISFEDVSGMNFGSPLEIDVAELCENSFTTLTLEFDDYAEETYWEIYDITGGGLTLVYEGGQGGVYGALDNETTSEDLCLAVGDYGIIVYDSYGDGGATFTVTYEDEDLATGTVPGGNPANVFTSTSATFTID